jgi:hypothetical protein
MEFSGLQAGRSRRWLLAAAVLLATLTVSGCQSKQDAAVEQAKKQAATTGQAQQVVSTDKDGNTVTTVVQPPVPGQAGQVVSTTVTPKVAGTQAAAAGGQATGDQAGTQSAGAQGGGAQVGAVTPVPAPAPPPEVHVAAGTTLAIRIDQRISAKGSHAGEKFTGEVVEPVMDGNGGVVIPKKSPVGGVVDFAHQRGHFKGAANIDLRLTSLTLNGKEYPLDTRDVAERKKGKGKRTGAFIGGGTGLGMLIGGIASGGTGVLIGGLAGAGAGTAGAGLTGNRDLVIPAESVVRFKLKDDLVIQP